MSRANYRPCPYCGLSSIRERQICKRCRGDMLGVARSVAIPPFSPIPQAATDITGHVYWATNGQATLFIVPHMLEYATPIITIRTAWANIKELRHTMTGTYLWLTAPSVVPPARLVTVTQAEASRIPLSPFSFPTNHELRADLRRFAPQLTIM